MCGAVPSFVKVMTSPTLAADGRPGSNAKSLIETATAPASVASLQAATARRRRTRRPRRTRERSAAAPTARRRGSGPGSTRHPRAAAAHRDAGHDASIRSGRRCRVGTSRSPGSVSRPVSFEHGQHGHVDRPRSADDRRRRRCAGSSSTRRASTRCRVAICATSATPSCSTTRVEPGAVLEPARGHPLAGRPGRLRPAADGDARALRVARPAAAHLAVAAPRRPDRPRAAAPGQRLPRPRRRARHGPATRPGARRPIAASGTARRRRRIERLRRWSTGARRRGGRGDRHRPARRLRRRGGPADGRRGETAASLRQPVVHALPRPRRRRAGRRRPPGDVRRARATSRRSGRPAGRAAAGSASLVTLAAAADAVAAGSDWTYLGVFADNATAIALYERAGFELVGEPAPDLLLVG